MKLSKKDKLLLAQSMERRAAHVAHRNALIAKDAGVSPKAKKPVKPVKKKTSKKKGK